MEIILAKDIFCTYFTGSVGIFKGACWLYYVGINATSDGPARITLYDGSGTNGQTKLSLSARIHLFEERNPCFPIYFRYGVYVEAVRNLSSGVIQLLSS